MNERFEKMMLEATKDMPQGYYVPGEYFQKFAELIVRECSNICDDIADPTLYREAEYHSRMAPGASYASKVIKLRFSELKNERTN